MPNQPRSKIVWIILYALGLSLLITLCVWQVQRGLAKLKVEKLRENVGVHEIDKTPKQWAGLFYKNVQLTGNWLSTGSFLLENRVYQGRVGFEVLTPFELMDNTVLMINRGWVADDSSVELPTTTKILGVLYQPEKGVQIGKALLDEVKQNNQWPKRSLYIDLNAFAQVLKISVQPVMLVLDHKEPASFTRIWKASVIRSNKHFGYAVQWGGLALTFLIYGGIWFRRRKTNTG